MLQLKRIIVHPITVCFLFCFIIISGESTGYFYLTLLMLGLSHLSLHSILGIGGILMVLSSAYKKNKSFVSIFALLGGACLLLSLIIFFLQPGGNYNYPTFRQFVPLTVLVLFSLSFLFFILKQIRSLVSKSDYPISTL